MISLKSPWVCVHVCRLGLEGATCGYGSKVERRGHTYGAVGKVKYLSGSSGRVVSRVLGAGCQKTRRGHIPIHVAYIFPAPYAARVTGQLAPRPPTLDSPHLTGQPAPYFISPISVAIFLAPCVWTDRLLSGLVRKVRLFRIWCVDCKYTNQVFRFSIDGALGAFWTKRLWRPLLVISSQHCTRRFDGQTRSQSIQRSCIWSCIPSILGTR